MPEAATAPCRTASAAGPNEVDLSGSSSAMCAFKSLPCGIATSDDVYWAMSGVVLSVSFSGGAAGAASVFAGDATGAGALCLGVAMGLDSTGASVVAVAQPLLNAANRIIRKAAIRCIRKITRQAKTYYM